MKVQRIQADSSERGHNNEGKVLRHVDPACRFQFEMLKETGLYNKLVSKELMIEQQIIDFVKSDVNSYCVIQWDRIPIISYSYEWSFDHMKNAALTVLRIQRDALDSGMMLRDASANNIQFVGDKAKLMDALCLELYEERTVLDAYDQFCRHFLAPLLLMKHLDIRLQQLLRIFHDGIPLDLASKMLIRSIDINTLKHIHRHAITIAIRTKAGAKKARRKAAKTRKDSQTSQIESLIHFIEKLEL